MASKSLHEVTFVLPDYSLTTLGLGVLSAVTAVPMLWLSGPMEEVSWTESADEEMERAPLLTE
jgi:hypothetical protein